jgi:hypothetical protein
MASGICCVFHSAPMIARGALIVTSTLRLRVDFQSKSVRGQKLYYAKRCWPVLAALPYRYANAGNTEKKSRCEWLSAQREGDRVVSTVCCGHGGRWHRRGVHGGAICTCTDFSASAASGCLAGSGSVCSTR